MTTHPTSTTYPAPGNELERGESIGKPVVLDRLPDNCNATCRHRGRRDPTRCLYSGARLWVGDGTDWLQCMAYRERSKTP